MLGVNIKKLLESSGLNIDVEKLAKESAQVPKMLKALIEQSNNQNRALEHIIKKVDAIEKKTDKAEEILALWDKLVKEDQKRQRKKE